VDIDPTPVLGVLGVVDRLTRRPPGPGLAPGGEVVLLGPEAVTGALAGSRWAWDRGARGGRLAPLDPAAHLAVAALVRDLVAGDAVLAVHDVADGGVALALAEAAVAGGTGAVLAGLGSVDALFGESPSRVVAVVADRLGRRRRQAEQGGAAPPGRRRHRPSWTDC
jgi:phosphoribosylformylglycinamidine synthase